MSYTKEHPFVQLYIRLVKSGAYTIEMVPAAFRALVQEALEEEL